ncbi:hypothetical protein [Geodermatophilus sp. SYSU D00696]
MFIAVAAAAGGLAASAGPALAAPVTVEHSSFTEDPPPFVEPAICDFPVVVDEFVRGTYTVVFDADGDFVRAQVHITYDADFSANGITIHQSAHWTDFDYADTGHRKVGLLAHVTGPDGRVVQHDAGIIFTFGGHENVVDYHGRHSYLEGETPCAALTP